MSETDFLEQGGKSPVVIWSVEDNVENADAPRRITCSDLGGGKVGLDVNVAGAVSLTATFQDYANGWAPAAAVAVAEMPTPTQIAAVADQVSIRLVPKDARTYYYHFEAGFTEAEAEPFDQNSPVEIQTDQDVWVGTANGTGAGSVAVYQATRS